MAQYYEYIYILFIALVYFRLRTKYTDKEVNINYNKYLLPIELLVFFSIFDNFLALPIGVNLKLPVVVFVLYSVSIIRIGKAFNYQKSFSYLLGFFLFILLSSLWIDINLHVTFRLIFVISWVVLLICIQSLLWRFPNYGLLIKNVCLIGIINGIVGIIEFALFQAFSFKLPFPLISYSVDTHPDLFSRTFGFMFEPNWYGLLQIIFFVVYVFLYKKINFWGISIFILSIVVTGNKITTLCLLPILYHVFFYHELFKSKSKKVLTFSFLGFCFFAFFGFLQQILIDRFSDSLSFLANNDSSTITEEYDRFVFISYLFNGFLEKPLIGHGLNTSIIVHNLIPWLNKSIDEIQPSATVQSGLFRLMYEQGILGLGLFAILIFKMFRNSTDKAFFKQFMLVFFIHFIFYDIWNALYSMPILFLIFLLDKKPSLSVGKNESLYIE